MTDVLLDADVGVSTRLPRLKSFTNSPLVEWMFLVRNASGKRISVLRYSKNARAYFWAFSKAKSAEIFYWQGFPRIGVWINPQVSNPQVALEVEVSRLCLIGHEIKIGNRIRLSTGCKSVCVNDWWQPCDEGMKLFLKVVPGARRSEVVVQENQLRVRVAAPAVEGKANDELRRVIAKWCNIRSNACDVVSGHHSRHKVVIVRGVNAPPSTE